MVSSLLVDTLNDPTRSLLELYDSNISIDDFPAAVSRHFCEIFNSPDAFREIPMLSVQNPPEAHPNRGIVQFRAMVRDISPSPEMYLARRSGGRLAGWGLGEPTLEEDTIDYSNLGTVHVLWAVNVPGESIWCSNERDDANATKPVLPHHPPQPHKFAVPGAPHIGVQIKLYDISNADNFKVTDVVTFVGILTSELLHPELERDMEVPTLHVLFSQPLPSTLMAWPFPATDCAPESTREGLLTWISQEALCGDRDAAEWLLLTSIARVQSPILPPTLTLSHFPSPAPGAASTTPVLSHILSSLIPISLTLPLTVDLLNNENFVPESRQEDLHSGFLQVPSGAHFLLTESGIKEGKLGEKGITNLRAIQEVMTTQKLAYVFPYSSFELETDIRFVVLSEGGASAFFHTSFTVPLLKNGDADVYKTVECVKMPEKEKLAVWRALVGGAMEGKVFVGEATSKYIQEDFVKQRQADKLINMDDLIRQMTVSRLMALSLHEREITVEIWERTKALDARRKARAS